MQQELIQFFNVQNFMPHGYCLGGDSPLLWLMVSSNVLMTLCYMIYPLGIAYFVWKRKDLAYRWLYLGFFIAFIVTCATTHFLSVVTIWIPIYWIEAYVNAISAIVALATVFAIWWVIPRALKLPSPIQLEKARDEAEAANRAKSAFLANMSHELRTPLNAILGFSELMSLDNSATTEQKETLAIINRSGAHLLSMINDVLDISKIEAGRLELDIQAFDLISFLNEISVMINIRAAKKQLNFRLDIDPEIAQFIKTDCGKLRQVLINLLGNAIKFTSKGSIVLHAKMQFLPTPQKTVLIIDVIDTGCGIAVDKQQEIFKPFIQLTQNNNEVKGTGLGLVISKSLVELMGGQISLNSELGGGSTFKIEIPVELANSTEITQSSDFSIVQNLAPNQPLWRLLVVDDNTDNRLLLTTMLSNIGFKIREANNGNEAIRVFSEWQPHLIWMDMRMPEMDGYEATAKIRQLAGGDKVKIIALTASAFREQHGDIIKAGCDAVLHKPFQVTEIYSALSNHLGVKFIYQESPAPLSSDVKLTTEMISNLPLELRDSLRDAALQLDIEEINFVIEKIRFISTDTANGLDELVRSFHFEQIVELTKS